MCWSGEASTVWATVGMSASLYAAYKKEDKALYLPLMYFSLMEILQAYTYTVINECGNPANQIATLLGYLHITFQPFFINAISMYFIPPEVRKKIQVSVYTLCFASAIIMIIQLFPFPWAGICQIGRSMCSTRLCSVSGNWHIAWEVPLNGIGNFFWRMGFPPLRNGLFSYMFVGFALPVIYGSWRMTLYHYVMGPMLAIMSTNNVNERPAVWCLLSIGFLLIVVKTPIRRILHVKRWFFYPPQAQSS